MVLLKRVKYRRTRFHSSNQSSIPLTKPATNLSIHLKFVRIRWKLTVQWVRYRFVNEKKRQHKKKKSLYTFFFFHVKMSTSAFWPFTKEMKKRGKFHSDAPKSKWSTEVDTSTGFLQSGFFFWWTSQLTCRLLHPVTMYHFRNIRDSFLRHYVFSFATSYFEDFRNQPCWFINSFMKGVSVI